jgi:hypothetical protein
MSPDPYRDLADVLEGASSLIDYYLRRMSRCPASVEAAKVALSQAIADLAEHSHEEFPG